MRAGGARISCPRARCSAKSSKELLSKQGLISHREPGPFNTPASLLKRFGGLHVVLARRTCRCLMKTPHFYGRNLSECLQLSACRDIFLRERGKKNQSHLSVPWAPAGCCLTPLPPVTFYSGVTTVTSKRCSNDSAGNHDTGNGFALGSGRTPSSGTKPPHTQHSTME